VSGVERLTEPGGAPGPAFHRVVLAHMAQELDCDLLDYAALLSPGEATIAAYPADAVVKSLAATARRSFAARGLPSPKLRGLSEPGWEAAFEAAREANSDLLIMRDPRSLGNGALFRVLEGPPSSVCLAPAGPLAGIRRIVAGVTLDDLGLEVLAHAAAVYRSVGAQELIVVHAHFNEAAFYWDVDEEKTNERLLLNLMRFLARAPVSRVACTPVVAEGPEVHGVLARVAEESGADLVVVGHRQGAVPRIAARLMEDGPAALLQVSLPPLPGIQRFLRRVFPEPVPKFN